MPVFPQWSIGIFFWLSIAKGGIRLDWEKFYDRFYNWEESTQINRISSLTSFGPSDEVAEIAMAYFEEKDASAFLRKAINFGVTFTTDEIMELINFCDTNTANMLLKTATCPFEPEQLEELWDNVDNDVLINIAIRNRIQYDADYGEFWRAPAQNSTCLTACPQVTYPPPPATEPEIKPIPPKSGSTFGEIMIGLLKILLVVCSCGIFLFVSVIINLFGQSSKPSPKPHYGYRYGRWFYGTGHRHGCQNPGEDPNCKK